MTKEIQIRVSPEIALQPDFLNNHVAKLLSLPPEEITHIEVLKRSLDARQKQILYNLNILVFINEPFVQALPHIPDYPDVSSAQEVLIIGAGPAGLFAALQLLQRGLKPVILERGKDVKKRIEDIRNINVHHTVNEDSNYCFGEGGAGAYSDGKLYTRSKKRGDVKNILQLLVAFGATKEILVDAHPHIGTNKLPGIIHNIRNTIIQHGGEIHFNSRVTDLLLESGAAKGVLLHNGEKRFAKNIILATGHSARDIYELLAKKNLAIELKPLAIGVRVEHPQTMIDSMQYKCDSRGPFLPPSPYSLVKQIRGRGVYSFCMCPGGVIAPCATKQNEIVTNGWSSSKRSGPFANSGIVVELRPADFVKFEKFGALAAMQYQKSIETSAWLAGGKTQTAPAQRLADFIDGKVSTDLPKSSYTPGIVSADLSIVLPKLISSELQSGFREFDKSMKGFITNEAVVHAPETRTSAPVKIPRLPDSLQHPQVNGLFPCGEGAGYAGGIVSAAIDGIKCAEAVVI